MKSKKRSAVLWKFANGARCDAVTSLNHSADTFRVEGSRGWMEFKQHAFTYRGVVAETSRGPLNYPEVNQQAAQMADFADCILNGRDTRVPGELGRRDVQNITAVYGSCADREKGSSTRMRSLSSSGGLHP